MIKYIGNYGRIKHTNNCGTTTVNQTTFFFCLQIIFACVPTQNANSVI